MQTASEISVELCHAHKDMPLSSTYPGYVFNQYLCFPARKCYCGEDAFFTAIGIQFPDAVGEIAREESRCRAVYEIYREAKALLDGGPALVKLTTYLRTRVIPSGHKELTAEKLLHHHAKCILEKLGLDPRCSISDTDKHRILVELAIYPEEM